MPEARVRRSDIGKAVTIGLILVGIAGTLFWPPSINNEEYGNRISKHFTEVLAKTRCMGLVDVAARCSPVTNASSTECDEAFRGTAWCNAAISSRLESLDAFYACVSAGVPPWREPGPRQPALAWPSSPCRPPCSSGDWVQSCFSSNVLYSLCERLVLAPADACTSAAIDAGLAEALAGRRATEAA